MHFFSPELGLFTCIHTCEPVAAYRLFEMSRWISFYLVSFCVSWDYLFKWLLLHLCCLYSTLHWMVVVGMRIRTMKFRLFSPTHQRPPPTVDYDQQQPTEDQQRRIEARKRANPCVEDIWRKVSSRKARHHNNTTVRMKDCHINPRAKEMMERKKEVTALAAFEASSHHQFRWRAN